MESLYRKYRPLTFDSVVGQQHIVSTLEHAISEGRLSHAYLFCGPRGTGKTTMARILAKALLCHEADAARATGASGCMPDGTCEECELIAAGNHPDVYELDAASRTGVDNVREEIINSVNFAPVRGAYKIYIIDEVHMLTTAAFNALLKTLEEPPAHVVFVLCTTDPQKILETILSRCQRFDFHRISNEDIEQRLAYVCEQEGFAYDDEALQIVARHARGGMRDALSTLEQLSVFGAGSVRISDARSLLGEVAGSVLADFARGIAARDVVALFGLVRSQVEEGSDLLELTRDLVAHMRDVYMVRVAGADAKLFECGADELEQLKQESDAFEGADRLARVLTVLDDASLEMRNASDARLVLEIALTRLSRPKADLTLEALAERVDQLERQIAAGAVPVSVAAAATTPVAAARPATGAAPAAAPVPAAAAPAARPASSTSRAAGSVPWDRSRAAAPAPAPTSASTPAPAAQPVTAPAAAQSVPASQPQPAPQPQPSVKPQAAPAVAAPVPAPKTADAPAPAATDDGDLQRKWQEVFDRVKSAQPSRAGLLLQARATADDGSTLTVSLPSGSGFSVKMLGRADSQALIGPIVAQVFGPRAVNYVMDGGAAAPAPRSEEPSPAAPAPKPAAPAAPAAAPATVPTPQTALTSAPKPVPAAPAPRPVEPAVKPVATTPVAKVSTPAPEPSAPAPVWEDDQVPYDDAFIAAFGEDDMPPFDVPAASRSPKHPAQTAPAAPAAPSVPVASKQVGPMPWEKAAAGAAPAPTAPAQTASQPSGGASAPAANLPFTHQAGAPSIPQTEEEAKDLMREVFGAGTIFKPVE